MTSANIMAMRPTAELPAPVAPGAGDYRVAPLPLARVVPLWQSPHSRAVRTVPQR